MTIQANFPNVQPSLLLDFANAKQLPPSVNFTRATTAAYYDGSTTAKAEENTLLQSQSFPSSHWTHDNATVTTGQTAPDGTSTAVLLTDNTSNSDHRIYTFPSASVEAYSIGSVYLKDGTRRYGMIRLQTSGQEAGAVFDLQAGTVASTGGANYYSSSITSIGSGWYRCVVIASGMNSGVGNFVVAMSNTATYNSNIAYIGNGSTLYAWAAQLENRSTPSVTAYNTTTTVPVCNYIPVLRTAGGGQPRFDHNPTTGVSLGLAIEKQSTNQCTDSVSLLATGAASVTAVATIAPDGSTNCRLVNVPSGYAYTGAMSSVVGGNTTWTYSFYIKNYSQFGSATAARIGLAGPNNTLRVYVDNLTTVPTVSFSDATNASLVGSSVFSVGNGWYRISVTGTYTGSVSYNEFQILTTVDTLSAFIWGMQLEQVNFPTSYIPTSGAAATRACETVTMTPAATTAILDINAGVMLLEANLPSTGYDVGTFACGIGYSSTNYLGMFYAGTGYFQPTHGGYGPSPSNDVAGGLNKAAISWSGTSGSVPSAYAQNGQVSATGNGSGVLTCFANYPFQSYVSIGFAAFDGAVVSRKQCWIAKVAVYPETATSAQLQALTA